MIQKHRTLHAFTLIEMLVSISVIALLTALLLPAVQSAREMARRMKCSSNFASVGIAVHNYVSSHSHFPSGRIKWSGDSPGCEPCVSVSYSMFARVLPYMDQIALYDSINFDASVDEPRDPNQESHYPAELANLTARLTTLDFLLCPSDSTPQSRLSAGTNIRSNDGSLPNTYALDNAKLAGPATVIHVYSNSMYHAIHTSALSSITDGLSTTALASEKLRGHDDAETYDARRHYAILYYPYDYRIPSDQFSAICLDSSSKLRGFEPKSGLAWIFGYPTSTTYNHVGGINTTHRDCITRGGEILGMISARSQHPGGVNVGMADGSVRFVRNGISLEIWRALGSKAGGETLSNLEY